MAIFDFVDLFYQSGGSDKEYHIQINSDTLQDGSTVYKVNTSWGRRGSAAATGILGIFNSLEKAQKAFNKKQAEQLGKGYQTPVQLDASLAQIYAASDIHAIHGSGHQAPAQIQAPQPAAAHVPSTLVTQKRRILWEPDPEMVAPRMTPGPNALNGLFHEEQPLPSAPAQLPTGVVAQLLNEIMDITGLDTYLHSDLWGMQEKKDGKHITARWDKPTGTISTINKKGELVVSAPVFLNGLKSALLDMPSMLLDGEQIGNSYFVYDLLELDGNDLRSLSYERRYSRLCGYFPLTQNISTGIIRVPLYTGTDKLSMFEQFKALRKEGVVFKRLAATFTAGKGHQDMWKWKWYATCSCRVSNRETGKHSVGLELLDTQQCIWVDVGNCTIAPSKALPVSGSIVEIKYLYAYRHGCLYQPSFIGPRDDVYEVECQTAQLKYKEGT